MPDLTGSNDTPGAHVTGLTMQFQTLARALGAAAGIMEDDLEDLAERGINHSAATLWLESRYVTVTILSAAVCEAVANTILLVALSPDVVKRALDRGLVSKWKFEISSAIDSASFLSETHESILKTLVRARNSIVHAKSQVYSGEQVVHEGDAEEWRLLELTIVRKFVQLPPQLLAAVPRTSKFNFPLESGLHDYWLEQAIQRGAGSFGRSPNVWRPESKEGRKARFERRA